MLDIGSIEPITIEQIHAKRGALAAKIAAMAKPEPVFVKAPVPLALTDADHAIADREREALDRAAEKAIHGAEEAKARVAAEIAAQETSKRDEYLESRRPIIMAMIAGGTSPHPSVAEIQRVVAAHYGVCLSDMFSVSHKEKFVRPRQIAMYLSKILTLRSLPEIGRRFGGRDHTTVLHAVRKIGALIASDPNLRHRVEMIQTDIIDRVLAAQHNS
jgi:chromosomal replication initiator protein